MLRVVVDTNIFVSSLLSTTGAPAHVIDAWRMRKYLLVMSEPLIAEIQSVLSSARIRLKYSIDSKDIEEIVMLLRREALMVPGRENLPGAIPADPQDEIILACALEGEADFIVSGDHHLLDLKEYRGIPILKAREFLQELENE
jgi:hypothetical protein